MDDIISSEARKSAIDVPSKDGYYSKKRLVIYINF